MKLFQSSPAKQHYSEAEEHLRKGESSEALRSLMLGFREDADYRPLYELAEKILRELGGEEEAELFLDAFQNFDSFDPFFKLGCHFVDVGNYDFARPFLEKAVAIDPTDPIAAYKLSLTMPLWPDLAVEVLERLGPSDEYWIAYRLNFLRLLAGRPEGVAQFIEAARDMIARADPAQGDEEENALAIAKKKLDELEECLLRYALFTTVEEHIKDWHFIQYGGAILDFFEDTDEYVAGGRYVAAFGTVQSVRTILETLRRLLTALDRLPGRVYGVDDRDSEIVGRAIARLLQKEFYLLTEDSDTTNALVVAGDNSSFNGFTDLFTVRPGQTVFALNLNWLETGMITPDVAGLMSQTYSFPWDGGGMQFVDDKIVRTQVDDRSPTEIAEEIAGLDPQFEDDFDWLLAFYVDLQDYLKGGKKDSGKRWSFARESPVPGAYFF